jgi:hypothetical protein
MQNLTHGKRDKKEKHYLFLRTKTIVNPENFSRMPGKFTTKNMKVQFHGQQAFSLLGKNAKVLLNPTDITLAQNYDIVTNSGNASTEKAMDVKKVLTLPGEYEISEVLVTGFYSRPENVVYRITIDDITFAHFGNIEKMPDSKLFEHLGENVDVVFVNLSTDCTEKLAKEIIDTLDPRMAIIGGDPTFFPKITEHAGAKTTDQNPMNLSRSNLSDEKTDILILPL